MARDTMMPSVKSEMMLSSIINSLARCVSGETSVGLNTVAVVYPAAGPAGAGAAGGAAHEYRLNFLSAK